MISGDDAMPWKGQSLARPDDSFSNVACHRNSPVDFAERHQHAAIAGLLRIAHRFVVRADEHDAAGDDRIAVALRSERRHPLDVLAGLDVPRRSAGRSRPRPCCDRAIRPTSASRSRPCRRWTTTRCAARHQRDSATTSHVHEFNPLIAHSAMSIASGNYWFLYTLTLSNCMSESRRRRGRASPCVCGILSIFSIVHAAGSGCAGRPDLAAARAWCRRGGSRRAASCGTRCPSPT